MLWIIGLFSQMNLILRLLRQLDYTSRSNPSGVMPILEGFYSSEKYAPRLGFEPRTLKLHNIYMFPYSVDYLFIHLRRDKSVTNGAGRSWSVLVESSLLVSAPTWLLLPRSPSLAQDYHFCLRKERLP